MPFLTKHLPNCCCCYAAAAAMSEFGVGAETFFTPELVGWWPQADELGTRRTSCAVYSQWHELERRKARQDDRLREVRRVVRALVEKVATKAGEERFVAETDDHRFNRGRNRSRIDQWL